MPNNRKPIIVSNPNDPRLRAYKDSLDFYSFNKRALDKVLKTNKSSLGSPVDVSKKRYLTREQDINEMYNRYKSLGLDITKKDVSDESDALDTKKGGKLIRKTGSYNFPITGGGIFRLAQYKKPEQPVEYRREDIPTLTPKIPTLNIQQPIDTPKVLPINKTVTPEVTPKKLPGGSGKFAQYPNMKKQLGNLKTSRMVNAKKVVNIVPTFKEGVNLVAGGEKHRVYVKKSPTGVGKGVKGHVMVNHPTSDKGKWDTIDLTEKAGAKTVEDGKTATRKWHAANPYVSGAKSVKQYRGDENLPEAKNGMKKNCGCKHTRSKYKYGSGAIVIPEKSAIVTANGGKNMQALKAYKQGNYKLLNKIIEQMPEDNVDKAQDGKQVTKVKGKYSKKDPATKETYQEQSVLGGPGYYGKEMPLDKAQNLYNLSDEEFENIYGKNKNSDLYKIEKGRREAVQEGNVTYTVEGKKGKDGKPLKYASGYRSKPTEEPNKDEKPQDTPEKTFTNTGGEGDNDSTGNKRKGNFLNNIPAMAEIAARGSILGQGIEGVPENYLKLGRYQYASQLPKTLQEIQLAEQAGRETARDIAGGDAGRYLAQSGNLSAARMKAANDAVIQDTLARQDILNKNVDLGNVEAQTNTGLKNQYAALRGQARAAYNDQLVALGQRVDSATETAQEMAGQRAADEQRLQTLKDLGINYDIKDIDGLLKLIPKTSTNTPSTTTTSPEKQSKKGLKRVKAYKRK